MRGSRGGPEGVGEDVCNFIEAEIFASDDTCVVVTL